MSRTPYIYSAEPPVGNQIVITDDEAQHLKSALRASPGFKFILFDGRGKGWEAAVEKITKKGVLAKVSSELPIEPEPEFRLTIAAGTIKAPRMDWAIEKMAEIGAYDFIPLRTEFSVVLPGEGKFARWKKIALSASKQSRRLRLMKISPVMEIDELLNSSVNLAVLHQDAESVSLLNFFADSDLAEICLMIGPEGGFSDSEIEMINKKGIPKISIGDKYYRTETAIVVTSGAIMSFRGTD